MNFLTYIFLKKKSDIIVDSKKQYSRCFSIISTLITYVEYAHTFIYESFFRCSHIAHL